MRAEDIEGNRIGYDPKAKPAPDAGPRGPVLVRR